MLLIQRSRFENPWLPLQARIYDMQKQSIELCNLSGSVKPTENYICKSNSHETKINNDSGHAQEQKKKKKKAYIGLAVN